MLITTLVKTLGHGLPTMSTFVRYMVVNSQHFTTINMFSDKPMMLFLFIVLVTSGIVTRVTAVVLSPELDDQSDC